MKRSIKNILLCLVMILSLTMTVLTVVHASGMTEKTQPSGAFADRPADGAAMPPDDMTPSEGEIIGEITVSGATESNTTGGSESDPPARPDGPENDRTGMTPPDRGGNATSAGTLTGHLLFAALWIFLFAFSAAWAVFSRMNAVSPFRRKVSAAENA